MSSCLPHHDYIRTLTPPADATDPVGHALGVAAGLGADALVVYDLETVGHTPSRVCEMLDLETVSPPMTWAAAMPGHIDSAHAHPAHALTVVSAQRIMQQHLICRAIDCPRKASAYSLLVRVGKIVPPVNTPRERAAARGLPFRPQHDNDVPLPEGVDPKTLLDVLAGLADLAGDTRASAGGADSVVDRPAIGKC